MSKSVYIPSFLIFCLLFVPVYFYFVIFSIISPIWVHLAVVCGNKEFDRLLLVEAVAFILQFSIYFGIFYLCARKSFQFSQHLSSPWRIGFQITALSGLFCLSFLEVNRGTAFVNEVDAGNVWDMFSQFLNYLTVR